MTAEIHDEGYDGLATLTAASTTLTEQVSLRGYFDPSDGRYHWYGRVAATADWVNSELVNSECEIRTPHGPARGRLSDPDAWGRMRIAGSGRPPFPTDLLAAVAPDAADR